MALRELRAFAVLLIAAAVVACAVTATGSPWSDTTLPTGYNGNGSIPTLTTGPQTRRAITASTNASPIVVTTGALHGYNTGDTVEVEGHLVNTAANGVWQITVVDTTHFSLNGSTGNGVGVATGRTIDYEIQPAFYLPAPGEAASMVTLGPVLEGLANLGPFLNRRTGTWRVYDILKAQASDPAYLPGGAYATITSLAAATWTPVGGPLLLTDNSAYEAGDALLIYCTATVQANFCPTVVTVGLGYASPGSIPSLNPIPSSGVPLIGSVNTVLSGTPTVAQTIQSYTMIAGVATGAIPTGVQIGLMAYSNTSASGGGFELYFLANWSIVAVHLRPN
jgi:hypothetical protein